MLVETGPFRLTYFVKGPVKSPTRGSTIVSSSIGMTIPTDTIADIKPGMELFEALVFLFLRFLKPRINEIYVLKKMPGF